MLAKIYGSVSAGWGRSIAAFVGRWQGRPGKCGGVCRAARQVAWLNSEAKATMLLQGSSAGLVEAAVPTLDRVRISPDREEGIKLSCGADGWKKSTRSAELLLVSHRAHPGSPAWRP